MAWHGRVQPNSQAHPGSAWHGMAEAGTAWNGAAQSGTAQPGMARHGPTPLDEGPLQWGARRAQGLVGARGPRLPAPCQGLLSPRALLPLGDPHPPPRLPARLPAHLLGCSPASLCLACLPASIPPRLSLRTPQCRRRAMCRGSGRARGPSGNPWAVPPPLPPLPAQHPFPTFSRGSAGQDGDGVPPRSSIFRGSSEPRDGRSSEQSWLPVRHGGSRGSQLRIDGLAVAQQMVLARANMK